MSLVGSVGGQSVVLGWLFSEKGISVRNNDKAPSQRVVCQTVANGTGHKPYTILGTCPYYVGFGVNLVYRLGIGVAYIPCRHLIVCEIVALIILVLLIRYLFVCCCLARRFVLPLRGSGCALDDFDSL